MNTQNHRWFTNAHIQKKEIYHKIEVIEDKAHLFKLGRDHDENKPRMLSICAQATAYSMNKELTPHKNQPMNCCKLCLNFMINEQLEVR